MSDELKQNSRATDIETMNTMAESCGCPEPGPETIEVEQVLGAETSQKVVEFDMFLPEQKPDIEQVIDVYVKDVDIDTVDVIRDKVIIRGNLEVKVMYVADLPNQPVHAFEKRHIRFTRDIALTGAEPGMDASADVNVEYVNYEFHKHHDRRKVYVTIVLKFWARVIVTTQMDVYALGTVSDVSEISYNTANSTTSLFNNEGSVSASQTGGGNIEGVGEENYFVTGPGMGYEHFNVTGPGIPQTAGTSMGVSGTGTITGDNVNIRTGPGTNFPVVVKAKKGDTVTIKEQAFGWYRVALNNSSNVGWVASWLVQTAGTPTNPKG